MGLIDDFLGGQKHEKREKHTIRHDRWDTDDYDRLREEMDMLEASRKDLADFVDTGSHSFGDLFFSLVKANPHILGNEDVMAKYVINRFVMDEAMKLDEYDTMRAYTTGDHVSAALASVDMEPDLEEIFDKLESQRKRAQDLQDAMEGLAEAEAQAQNDAEDNAEATDYQQNSDMLEAARQAVAAAAQSLEESLGEAGQEVRASLQQSFNKAIEEAHDREDAMQMWGLSPGHAQRLPAAKRIEMAKRMNNEKFRRIAKLFGPMMRMAFSEQRRKTVFTHDEVHSVEQGSDLSRILPIELLALADPATEMDFLRRYYEGGLQQWHLKGEEGLAKGGIIFCGDNSGSMTGDCEVWMKAVGLALLQVARAQRRPFFGIHYGSTGEYKTFDFDTSRLDPELVLEFAEFFLGGGTCFMTPLSVALDRLEQEYGERGAVKADIVFVTDGQCGVDETWLEQFKERQRALDFNVYGVIIGGHPGDEPLNTICDNKVASVQKLNSGDEVKNIFRGV